MTKRLIHCDARNCKFHTFCPEDGPCDDAELCTHHHLDLRSSGNGQLKCYDFQPKVSHPKIVKDFILKGIGGKPDIERFNSPEKIEAIGDRIQKACEKDFKKFNQAKRESENDAMQFVVD